MASTAWSHVRQTDSRSTIDRRHEGAGSVEVKAGRAGQPEFSANRPRLAEAGGRPGPGLALAGRAEGRSGRRRLCFTQVSPRAPRQRKGRRRPPPTARGAAAARAVRLCCLGRTAVLTRTSRGPPYCTYGLRVPASCVPHVPKAQGSFPPRRHTLYVRGTRTSLGRAVRTAYRGTTGRRRAPRHDPNP